MITQIGLIAGEILDLLEKNNGLLVYGEISHELKRSHDQVLMSIGWLLREGEIQLLEDPLTNNSKHASVEDFGKTEACLFDLVVTNNLSSGRLKDIKSRLAVVIRKTVMLLDGNGDAMYLHVITENLKEPRDIVLMGLGWLIRKGYVKAIEGADDIFMFRLHKENVNSKRETFVLHERE